jgi:hypothetical protein
MCVLGCHNRAQILQQAAQKGRGLAGFLVGLSLMQHHSQPPGPWGPGPGVQSAAPTESITPIMMAVGQPAYASHSNGLQLLSSGSFTASFSQQPPPGMQAWIPPGSAHGVTGNSMLDAPPIMMSLQGLSTHLMQPSTVPWNPPELKQEDVRLPGTVVTNPRTSMDSYIPIMSEVVARE